MLLGTLGANFLGSILRGKIILRAGYENKEEKGVLRSGYGNKMFFDFNQSFNNL